MLYQKSFGLLSLVQIEVLNFIGKSLNLAPSTLLVPRRSSVHAFGAPSAPIAIPENQQIYF